jgi:hypothetical protein
VNLFQNGGRLSTGESKYFSSPQGHCRSVKCDQDAFDILYDTYQRRYDNGEISVGNIREKVAILDRDALNSG